MTVYVNMSGSQTTTSDMPSSPEDGGNFRRSLQIDMKGLVGDAVGNVWRKHCSLSVHSDFGLDEYKSFIPGRCSG